MHAGKKPKRKGNYKTGPGRPKGSKNKKTLALEAAARQAAASIDDAFQGDAHAFLTAVYQNPKAPLEIRILAATKALRVEKPALSAVGAKVGLDGTILPGGATVVEMPTTIELVAAEPVGKIENTDDKAESLVSVSPPKRGVT